MDLLKLLSAAGVSGSAIAVISVVVLFLRHLQRAEEKARHERADDRAAERARVEANAKRFKEKDDMLGHLLTNHLEHSQEAQTALTDAVRKNTCVLEGMQTVIVKCAGPERTGQPA